MNQYAQRLLELQGRPSHKLKEIGDQWQTPKPLAWGLFHHFAPKIGPVVLDLFADMSNALVGCFYTAADNALLQDWAGDSSRQGGACYANPPYSRPESDEDGNAITGMEPILDYCREQRDQGAKIMLLIKAATSDGWWPEDADFIQFISGRIGFEAPDWYTPADPVKDKPSSSGFASAVVIFDRDWKWERRPIERLNRDDLITTGEIILGMIDYRAAQLVSKLRGSVHTQDTAAPTETVDNLPDASQATVKEPKPVCVVRIYQSISGEWAAEYLQNNVAMASIGGCDAAEEALAAADDQGWVYDHIAWPHDIGPDDDSEISQTSVQLDMLDASHAACNDTEPASVMPLADWYWQYQNDGPLSLDDGQWPHFVVVLTIIYGVLDQYTSRQVAVACSICDEQLMDEFTTMSDETKERIRRCSMAIAQAETDTPMSDEQRQTAVTALLASVDDQKLSLKEAELIARSAVLVEEVAA
jgi:phage N-6-adenine-methyltransferase